MNQGATVKSKNKTPKTSTVSKTDKASFGLSRGARRRVTVTAPNAAHLKACQEGYRKGTSDSSQAGKSKGWSLSDPAGCLRVLPRVDYIFLLYIKGRGVGGGRGSSWCIITSLSNLIVYVKILCKALHKSYYNLVLINLYHCRSSLTMQSHNLKKRNLILGIF